MWNATDDYFAEIAKDDYTAVAKIDVTDSNGLYLATLPKIVPGGNVDCDETRQVRRTPSFTIQSSGLDNLVPKEAGDLLHPDSGNEIRPYRGVVLPSGQPEWIPLGIFGMTKPVVTDTGDSLSIAISGNDRSAAVSNVGYNDPYSITGGTNLGTAVQALIDSVLPGLSYNFAPTDASVPATTFGTSTSSNDPFADAVTLVTAAGMELFFDVSGICVMRPISNPTTDLISATFTEGEGGVKITSAGRTLDETAAYKGVIVIGNGTGGAPVRGEAWVDPSNPGGKAYKITTALVPYPGQSGPDAVTQANAIAAAQLPLVCKANDAPTWTAIPDATVQEGDCVELIRERAGINSEYAVTNFTIPLDVTGTETFNGRPRQQS